MERPRISAVYFRQLKNKSTHILVSFSNGSTVLFLPGQMLHKMQQIRFKRVRLVIINNMAYDMAIKGGRQTPAWIQDLLCEYQIAAQEMGAKLFGPPTGKEGQS
jgi:hypothetical protein